MLHRDSHASGCEGNLRSRRKEAYDIVEMELTMRAVFPLTPNEDLKAGQYWFARRTADAEVAPAQAEDLAPAQIASVTQSDCVFFLSVSADPFCGAMPFSRGSLFYPRRYQFDELSAHAWLHLCPAARVHRVRGHGDFGMQGQQLT